MHEGLPAAKYSTHRQRRTGFRVLGPRVSSISGRTLLPRNAIAMSSPFSSDTGTRLGDVNNRYKLPEQGTTRTMVINAADAWLAVARFSRSMLALLDARRGAMATMTRCVATGGLRGGLYRVRSLRLLDGLQPA